MTIHKGGRGVGHMCRVPVVFDPYYLPDVAFNVSVQVGVALTDTITVPEGAALGCYVDGVSATQVDSVTWSLSGAPTTAGTFSNGLVLFNPRASNNPHACLVVVKPSVPVNTVLPTISGLTEEGQTLTASSGTWTNSPTSYAYQWFRKTVSETAISGAYNATYVPVSADVGATLRCRVRAFNSGGGGSAYQVYTAYTAAIVAASPAPPVNTVAPALTASQFVGEVFTTSDGTWTGASGPASYQWMRGSSAIPGATSSTYRTTWADANQTIYCLVTRGNGSGASTVATSAGLLVYALLSPAFWDYPEWLTTNKHRWIPRNLVNPLEFGATRSDARPGTGVMAQISNSNWYTPQMDARQDWLADGPTALSSTLTKAVYKVRGGRYGRVHRWDAQGAETDVSGYVGGFYWEGVRLVCTGLSERDQWTITGGNGSADHTGQDLYADGSHSTNLATYISKADPRKNTIPVSDLRMIAPSGGKAQMQMTLSGTPLSGIPLSSLSGNQSILIYGSVYRGSNRTNYDANQPWDVISVTGSGGAGSVVVLQPSDTGADAKPAYDAVTPANNVVDISGATAIALGCQLSSPAANVPHADGMLQLNKDKPSGPVRIHRFHARGGYQAFGIVGNASVSDCDKYFSMGVVASDTDQDPQDRLTTLFTTGGQFFTPQSINEFFECYADNTARPYQSLASMIFPGPSITSVPYGATLLTDASSRSIMAYIGTTGYLGTWVAGTPADGSYGASGGSFVATSGVNVPGLTYQSRGYGDLRAPVEGDLAADPFVITPGLTGGASGHFNMTSGATAGAEFGDIDVAHTLPGNCVIDVFISDALGAVVTNNAIKFEGRILKKSSGALAAGSYSFYVTAKVSTLDVNFQRVDTGIKRTKLITETVV